MTIWGNKLCPNLMDHFLARNAVGGQQTDETASPDRPDNLWQAMGGDTGARGRFGNEAHDDSAQLWLTTHRRQVGLAAGVALLVGTALLGKRQQRHRYGRLSRFR